MRAVEDERASGARRVEKSDGAEIQNAPKRENSAVFNPRQSSSTEGKKRGRARRVGRSAPPPLFSRADFLRLLGLAVLLAVVLLAIQQLRDPSFARKHFAVFEPDDAQFDAMDGVQIVGDSGRDAVDAAPTELLPVEAVETQAPPAAYNPLKLFQTNECREVDRELLAQVVKDKTPVRSEERQATFQVLCVAATTPPGTLAKLARRDVSFADLFQNPAEHRGTPLRLRGLMRRLEQFDVAADDNPYGFAKYYGAWVFPDDQPQNAARIVFAELPPNLAPGEDLAESIEIDAFFIKLLAYRTVVGKVRAAPLLVGFRPRLVAVEQGVGQGAAVVGGLFLLLVFVVAGIWMWQARRDRKIESEIRPHTAPHEAPPPEFTSGEA